MKNSYWFILLMACFSGSDTTTGEGGVPGGSDTYCAPFLESHYTDYTTDARFGDSWNSADEVVSISEGGASLHVEPDVLTITYTTPEGDEVVLNAVAL